MSKKQRIALTLGIWTLIFAAVITWQYFPHVLAVSSTPHEEAHTEAQPAAETPRDPNRLWCGEHGVYEDECLICHPELEKKSETAAQRDPNRLWCGEHGVYEDECVLCHPELANKTGSEGLFCNEHNLPEAECGTCHPELAAALEPGQGVKVRLASGESAEQAGISVGRAAGGAPEGILSLTSRVEYNGNRLARVASRVSGVVETVAAEPGEAVKKGSTLAEVSSSAISEAQGELRTASSSQVLAQKAYNREKELFDKRISARSDFEEADEVLRAARIRTQAAREHLEALGAGSGKSVARAPFDGVVIERHAVAGESVTEGDPLYTIADLSTLWLELAIPENRLAQVQVGNPVKVQFDALQGVTFDAEVAWIDTQVDAQSRTLKARALIANPNGLLKAGMFGRVELAAGGAQGVHLPSAAVQQVEGKPVVFVKLEDDLYEVRGVALGKRDGERVEIVEGVTPDDEVVLARSYTLKSEFLKSRLGAGCTDH